jgi:hypothetical protein
MWRVGNATRRLAIEAESGVWDVFGSQSSPLPQQAPSEAGLATGGKKPTLVDMARFAGSVGLGSAKLALGCAKYALMFWVAVQVGSMGVQAAREAGSSQSIKSMRTEQRWMESQGLADARRIGVVVPGAHGHLTTSVNSNAYTSQQESLLGWDMIGPLAGLSKMGSYALGVENPVKKGWAISAPRDEISRSGFDPELKMTYRHEEGHARMHEKKLRAGPAQAWTPSVGSVVAAAIDEAEGLAPRPGLARDATSGSQDNWRSSWLSETRSEAFADAFAVLCAARKGQGELAKVAVSTHAFRLMSNRATTLTSTVATGSSHSVEMASFIAGQLDEKKVAALSSEGLDELAGKIADDTVAWAVARQAPMIGFFEPAGLAWWTAQAKRSDVPEAQAKRMWDKWAKAALAEQPREAFGEFQYLVKGQSLNALGLDAKLARSEMTALASGKGIKMHKVVLKTNWRYDGHGGLVVMLPNADVQEIKGQVKIVIDQKGDRISGSLKDMESEKQRNRWDEADQGAISQHMLLARRAGMDLEKHAKWLEQNGAEKMFPKLAGLFAEALMETDQVKRPMDSVAKRVKAKAAAPNSEPIKASPAAPKGSKF